MRHDVSYTLAEIASRIGATLEGDPDRVVTGVSGLEAAGPSDITAFYKNELQSASSRHQQYLAQSEAAAVILEQDARAQCPVSVLVVANPKLAFARVCALMNPPKSLRAGVHASSVLGSEVEIDPSAEIGPHCVLGDRVKIGKGVRLGAGVVIGEDCVVGEATELHPRVVLYSDTHLGKACIVHSGAVLGSDGFGFANESGRWYKMPHLGGVRIGDGVEIGANTTIDRGVQANTEVADGVVLDNQIHLAHNVKVGAHTAIAGCVGIAGSTTIGAFCMIGGGSRFNGHITVVDRAVFLPCSNVANSVKQPGVYSSGLTARPVQQWKKNIARFHRLDALANRVKQLEKAFAQNDGLTIVE